MDVLYTPSIVYTRFRRKRKREAREAVAGKKARLTAAEEKRAMNIVNAQWQALKHNPEAYQDFRLELIQEDQAALAELAAREGDNGDEADGDNGDEADGDDGDDADRDEFTNAVNELNARTFDRQEDIEARILQRVRAEREQMRAQGAQILQEMQETVARGTQGLAAVYDGVRAEREQMRAQGAQIVQEMQETVARGTQGLAAFYDGVRAEREQMRAQGAQIVQEVQETVARGAQGLAAVYDGVRAEREQMRAQGAQIVQEVQETVARGAQGLAAVYDGVRAEREQMRAQGAQILQEMQETQANRESSEEPMEFEYTEETLRVIALAIHQETKTLRRQFH